MFTKLTLDNFKSFDHIELDLMGKKKEPKKLALIYGENGAGKSNIVEAFMFLRISLMSAKWQEMFSLTNMTKACRTQGDARGLKLRYDFIIDDKQGYYLLEFDSDDQLINESLVYAKKERRSILFAITPEKVDINFATKGSYKSEIKDLIQKYWGKQTTFAIIRREMTGKNPSFMANNIEESFFKVIYFFGNVLCQINTPLKDALSNTNYTNVANFILDSLSLSFGLIPIKLDKGITDNDQSHTLTAYEDALNTYFTSLYSDIKKVFYKTSKNYDNKIEYELFFDKIIAGKLRTISIIEESTGTKKLLELFRYFYAAMTGHVVIYDELDTGVHDILMQTVMEAIKDKITGQLIATTHNTLLLESIPPESAYLIQADHEGHKFITSIDKIGKTQKNHSNRSRYLRGVFGAVPMPAYLDMSEIAATIDDMLKVTK